MKELNKVIDTYNLKFNITGLQDEKLSEKDYTILVQELKTKYKIYCLENNLLVETFPELVGVCRKSKNATMNTEKLAEEIELVENTLKMECLFKAIINN
jgi:hypothetical protein